MFFAEGSLTPDGIYFIHTTQALNLTMFMCYSGCQKNVPVFKRFFLQPYKRLHRTSVFRNTIMESGINFEARIKAVANRRR